MELLAPAGSLNILKIAIESGCDAVYISGKDYGARKAADNFTREELKEAVCFAHLRRKKVYITINTLLYDEEFIALHEYLSYLVSLKVDAVIVQDLGVIHYIRTNFPSIIVHASTQQNINSLNGAQKLIELGVKRVVLARETPIEIVKEIVKLPIEVEIFVHGALCFSCSGQCLMSYLIGGRSGNRGECAQPCRKKYQLLENNNPICNELSLMSMKDLQLLDELKMLKSLNIASLKIEGRLKSASYVSTVVRIYRNHLDGIISKDDEKELELAFNRKFTKGYIFHEQNQNITNQKSVNHQGLLIGKIKSVTKQGIYLETTNQLEINDGIRILGLNEVGFYIKKIEFNGNAYFIPGHFNVRSGDLVYKTVSNKQIQMANDNLKHELYHYYVRMVLIIIKDEKLTLKVECQNYKFMVKTNLLEEEAQNVLDDNRIISQIKKTNDDLFIIDDVEIINDHHAFVRISEINEIRRMAIEKLKTMILDSYMLPRNQVYCYQQAPTVTIAPHEKISFDFIVHNTKQYDWCLDNGFTQVYLANTPDKMLGYNNHLNFNYHISNGLVHNLGEMNEAQIYSPSCNILNREALLLLNNFHPQAVYLSNELSKEQIFKLGTVNTIYEKGIFMYGRKLMLVSHHCFISAVKNKNLNCQSCQKNRYYLQDEYHNKMMVSAACYQNGPELLLYDYHLTNNFNDLIAYFKHGITRFLIVITDETTEQLENLKKMIRKAVNNVKR